MSLHVYRNEATDWFVAESAEEAVMLYRDWLGVTGCTLSEAEFKESAEFYQCADDKVIHILPDEDQSLPAVAKTCAEWCASNGKGFLCSENY